MSAPKESDFREGMLQARELVDHYGALHSPLGDDYLAYLQVRLVNALPSSAKSAPPYHFVLLNSTDPLAYSPGGGQILFSKGLVRSLRSEAELAFVLSHELAHQQLGHSKLLAGDGDLDGVEKKDLELQADRYAVGLMAKAGYDPRYAISAIDHAYGTHFYEIGVADYPPALTRTVAIHEQILASGWMPPGTADRRDFRKFRAWLLEN